MKCGDIHDQFARTAVNRSELKDLDDPFLNWIIELYPQYLELREKEKERNGRLDSLYGELVSIKQQFQNANFVPDANATLRITFGRVKGYSPEDAVYKSPITSLTGVVDKTTGEKPFITPQRILDMHARQEFGRYKNDKNPHPFVSKHIHSRFLCVICLIANRIVLRDYSSFF